MLPKAMSTTNAKMAERKRTKRKKFEPVTLRDRQRRGTCDLLAPKRPVRATPQHCATQRPARAAGRQTAG